MSKSDGGPAFPMPFQAMAQSCGDKETTLNVPCPGDTLTGMTLRDWFAGNERSVPSGETYELTDQDWADRIAKWRYICADAMLKERDE